MSQPFFYNYQLVFRDNLIVTFKNCIIACLRVLIPALCFQNLVGYFYYFFLQVRSFKITARTDLPCFHVLKIVGFRPAGFVLVRWIQALYELISALSWAFLDASKELVLTSKGFWKKVAEKAHFGLGPRLESPRFEWTWKQADCVLHIIINSVSP